MGVGATPSGSIRCRSMMMDHSPLTGCEKLLRGRSASLPLVRNLDVALLRLGLSLACAYHPGLLATFFNNLLMTLLHLRNPFAARRIDSGDPRHTLSRFTPVGLAPFGLCVPLSRPGRVNSPFLEQDSNLQHPCGSRCSTIELTRRCQKPSLEPGEVRMTLTASFRKLHSDIGEPYAAGPVLTALLIF